MNRELTVCPPRDLTEPVSLPLHAPTPRADKESAPPRRRPQVGTAVVCVLLALALCGVMVPALRTAYLSLDGRLTLSGVGKAIGRVLLSAGLAPTDRSPLEGWGILVGDDTTDGSTYTEDPTTSDPTESDTTTVPFGEDTTDGDLSAEGTTVSDLPEEGTTAVDPSEDDTTEGSTTEDGTTEVDLPEGTTAADPPPAVPEGCVPIVSLDASLSERGAGYLVGEVDSLPPSLPADGWWGGEGTPTVLIVNTHPYEGYWSGEAWYDPATGGLSQVESPSDPDGVVALASNLTARLRSAGVSVIHLRVAVSEGDTAGDIYRRTEEQIRRYCAIYPEIGLVLDLRRSAELTGTGEILRTAGSYEGEPISQVRISVGGGRPREAFARDLALALALRQSLWGVDASVSRPVQVRSGTGIAGDLSYLRVLTLELGAAGNTYAESARLVPLLERAVANLIGSEL